MYLSKKNFVEESSISRMRQRCKVLRAELINRHIRSSSKALFEYCLSLETDPERVFSEQSNLGEVSLPGGRSQSGFINFYPSTKP